MLPAFQIRNLRRRSSLQRPSHDALICVDTTTYDRTISSLPQARLKYRDDDDGDVITVGSSLELEQHLSEKPSMSDSSRMSMAQLLNEQPHSLLYHAFDIDGREEVQQLWQDIQTTSSGSENLPSIAPSSLDPYRGHLAVQPSLPLAEKFVSERDFSSHLGQNTHVPISDDSPTTKPHSSEGTAVKDNSKSPAKPSGDVLYVRELPDYRSHYFNATSPPQLQVPKEAALIEERGSGSPVQSRPSIKSRAMTPMARGSSMIGLTMEGRRQAQAAGEKVRTRNGIFRQRTNAINSDDYLHHSRNRWAAYKTPLMNSGAAVQTMVNVSNSQSSSLTSEGRRQAQVAGDKLRCRTNPIRHSRPARIGSSEYGLNKNRWPSYSGESSLLAGFEECLNDVSTKCSEKTGPATVEPTVQSNQSTLLEVFEAELSKDDHSMTNQSSQSPGAEALLSESGSYSQSPPQMEPLFQSTNKPSESSASEEPPTSGDVSRIIDRGLSTVLDLFCDALGGMSQCLEEASHVTRKAADRTREADFQAVNETIRAFREFTAEFNANRKEFLSKSPISEKTPMNTADSSGNGLYDEHLDHLDAENKHAAQEPAKDLSVLSKDSSTKLSEDDLSHSSVAAEQPSSSLGPQKDGANFADLSRRDSSPSSREILSAVPQMNLGPYRYHKPGPIHLPHQATLVHSAPRNEEQQPPWGSGYVNRLRQYHSIDLEEDDDKRSSPSHTASRFPTLAQFENSNFKSVPSFPSLPSMEPLIPVQITRRIASDDPPHNRADVLKSLPRIRGLEIPAALLRGNIRGGEPEGSESSGEFFNRMTGLQRSSTKVEDSRSRLTAPFDPLDIGDHRYRTLGGLNRSATVTGPSNRNNPTRRPYSETFGGHGRIAWNEFLRDAGGRGVNRWTTTEGDEHEDGAIVDEMADCVGRLEDLGFGREVEGSRLLMYAQAADGDLWAAVDMMLEEEEAYKERKKGM